MTLTVALVMFGRFTLRRDMKSISCHDYNRSGMWNLFSLKSEWEVMSHEVRLNKHSWALYISLHATMRGRGRVSSRSCEWGINGQGRCARISQRNVKKWEGGIVSCFCYRLSSIWPWSVQWWLFWQVFNSNSSFISMISFIDLLVIVPIRLLKANLYSNTAIPHLLVLTSTRE